MRHTLLIFGLFIFILSGETLACDSVRVAVMVDRPLGEEPIITHSVQSYYWDSTGTIITWLDSVSKEVFTYDSLRRITSREFFYIDSGIFIQQGREEFYYSISGKDSLRLRYSYYQGSSPELVNRRTWQYDGNDSIVSYLEEGIYGATSDTINRVATWYPTTFPDIVRVDSLFNSSGTFEYLHAYTMVGPSVYYRIFDPSWYIPPDLSFQEQFFSGGYECGYLSGSTYYSPFTQSWNAYTFDNNCRLLQFSHGTSGANGGGYDIYYLYGDCNHMVMLMQTDKDDICRGDSTTLYSYVYGGAKPYHYQWTPAGTLVGTASSTIAVPNDTTDFIMTVTDSSGLVLADTLRINVEHINPPNLSIINIDSTNGCYTADLTYVRTNGASHVLERDTLNGPYNYYDPPPIHIVYNGMYYLTVATNDCPVVIDSIEVNQFTHESPHVTATPGCNELIASSPTANDFNWYATSPPVLVHQGPVVSFNTSTYYYCEAVDSLGCKSERGTFHGEYFYIDAYFYLSCNDSCNSIGQVYANPWWGHTYQYLWSSGDTTTYTNTLCDGVASITVTNELGCVLTETNDTCTISVEEVEKNYWKVFPIPANSELFFETERSDFPYEVILTDFLGRKVLETEINMPRTRFTLRDDLNGIYLLQVIKNGKRLYCTKAIVY